MLVNIPYMEHMDQQIPFGYPMGRNKELDNHHVTS
jgi:hypothetical protein